MSLILNINEIALRCVWADYQPIRADMELDPLIHSSIDRLHDALIQYGISRITLINDVIYPLTHVARDVLKFDTADIQRLNEEDKRAFFQLVEELAAMLILDPLVQSQAVMWNNDIYILMSTRAVIMKRAN